MEKNQGGRPPTEYDKDITPILAEGYAKEGLNNEQIAHNLGIGKSLFYEWQNKYVEFKEAIKRGKEVADFEIENALYKLAKGFKYEESNQSLHYNKETGKYEVTSILKSSRESIPNYKAIEFWLRNRQPQKWNKEESIPETKPPIVKIEVKDNSNIKEVFDNNDI